MVQISIIVPEGHNSGQIAGRLKRFRNFDADEFLKIAKNEEGYLFPDTYFLSGNETEEEIIKIMKENFYKKAGEMDYGALTMASLIEREAADYDDRRLISGVLWKRLEVGMPLQVDAEPDTYLYKGLPPIPICNPGLDAIDAARNPLESPYWYYLSDKNGVTYFAETFEEHKLNKEKYLR